MRLGENTKCSAAMISNPTSEVIARINFVPPDMKTYKIIQARGNSKGEKIVRELLDRETESAKKGLGSEITRANYDFVFLRARNLRRRS